MNSPGALTLLVVDDDFHLRFLLVGVLRKAFPRAQLLEAANADEGLSMTLHHTPDLVVTDQRMAGMTGLEMIAALRAHGIATPMILLTGVVDPECGDLLKCADAVLEKIGFQTLPAIIRRLLPCRCLAE